ncbi:MAG: membrane protein insertion efficiency factor YidD [Bacteroidota bacterium]
MLQLEISFNFARNRKPMKIQTYTLLKRKPLRILFFLCVILFSSNVFSQSKSDFTFLAVDEHRHKPEYRKYVGNSKNELQFIFSSLFLFYKTFISSQDMPSCKFHPSCSEYALLTLKKNGPMGLFDAFDRLSRCNNSEKDFPIDAERDKYIDFP